jgi:hypothetical protein
MSDPIIAKLESCTSFRVDAYCEGYPDVIFEIILDAVPILSPLIGKYAILILDNAELRQIQLDRGIKGWIQNLQVKMKCG